MDTLKYRKGISQRIKGMSTVKIDFFLGGTYLNDKESSFVYFGISNGRTPG